MPIAKMATKTASKTSSEPHIIDTFSSVEGIDPGSMVDIISNNGLIFFQNLSGSFFKKLADQCS